MDDEPKPGDTVPLADMLGNVTFHGLVSDPNANPTFPALIQGPPGPAATLEVVDHSGYLTFNPELNNWVVNEAGTRPVPAVQFEVGGWQYSFPSVAHARLVRERLMKMTLEGEL